MTRRRYPQRTGRDAELFPELIGVLLDGWSALSRPEPDDPFRIFDYHAPQLRAAWQKHRAVLMAEWKRRGGKGPTYGEQQFEGAPGPYQRSEQTEDRC